MNFIALMALLGLTGVLGDEYTLQSPTIDLRSSFDRGLTYKQFTVQYPGVCVETLTNILTLKIQQITLTKIETLHSLGIPIASVQEQNEYLFALDNATPARYAVQLCSNTTCSAISKTLTSLISQPDMPSLTCNLVTLEEEPTGDNAVKAGNDKQEDAKQWKIVNHNAGKFEINPVGVMRLYSGAELNNMTLLKWTTQKINEDCNGTNPCYNRKQGNLYVAYPYDIGRYKQLFDNIDNRPKQKSEGQSITRSAEYCQRKYLLTSNVHLVQADSKEIKYRFKTTFKATKDIIEKFIMKDVTIPVEGLYTANIQAGTYQLWVSTCVTEKDGIDTNQCTEPLVTQNFVVDLKGGNVPPPAPEKQDPEEDDGTDFEVDDLQAGNVDDLQAGNVDDLQAGNVDDLQAGNVDDLQAGNVDDLQAGNVDDLQAGNVDNDNADDPGSTSAPVADVQHGSTSAPVADVQHGSTSAPVADVQHGSTSAPSTDD